MININITNLTPQTTPYGCATTITATPVIIGKDLVDNNLCICSCEYKETVFALAGGFSWQNDKTSMLFKKIIAADGITIKLYKDDSLVATITDNTYGVYFSTFVNKPLYVGFIADWELISTALGFGNYQFKILKSSMGISTTIESIKYICKPYDDELAEGTVRIDTRNTGTILSSELDYDGMYPELTYGWYQSIRIMGRLMPKQPKMITDNYLDTSYTIIQNQDKITNEWTLITELLPASVGNLIIEDMLLSNRIYISDYNAYNEEVIRERELYCVDIVEKKSYTHNNNSIFIIKFADRRDNIIKNNF